MDVTPPPAPSGDRAGVRPRGDVEALVTWLTEVWQQYPSLRGDFTEGIVDTALWALGRVPAPVSSVPGPPGLDALREEDDRAHQLIYDAAAWGGQPLRKDWAVGVQHTAMWLRGATDSRPGFGWPRLLVNVRGRRPPPRHGGVPWGDEKFRRSR